MMFCHERTTLSYWQRGLYLHVTHPQTQLCINCMDEKETEEEGPLVMLLHWNHGVG